MSKRLKRILKADFKRGNALLPRALAFLGEVDFHAVVEDHSGARVKRTIELTASVVKALSVAREQCNELLEICASVAERNRILELTLKEAANKIEALDRANKRLYELVEQHEGPRSEPRSTPSHLGRALQRGFQPNGLPLQGGLPSLGKKK